jgi:tetratricopeptide (TPR) repeat protein
MEHYSAAQRLIQMNRFEEAAKFLQRCYEQCELTGDGASCETLLGEIAICYQKADRYEDSAKALFQLLNAIRNEGPTQRRAILHHNLGFLYEMQKDFDLAEDQFRRSSEIASEAGDRRGQALSLAMMAQVVITNGRLQEGFKAFIRAIAILHEISAPELAHVIEHTRFMAERHEYDDLQRLARDSIHDDETLKKLLESEP